MLEWLAATLRSYPEIAIFLSLGVGYGVGPQLVRGMAKGKFIFRFDPAILLGACAGARTTTAALGMVCEQARSQVPALGYTVTYAVGNTLLTIWGMVIIILLT
jgi:putative transport protein